MNSANPERESARFGEMTAREKELYAKLVAFREAERRQARKSRFLSDFFSEDDMDSEYATESPEDFVIIYRKLEINERLRFEKELDDGFEASQQRLVAASRAALHRPFVRNE